MLVKNKSTFGHTEDLNLFDSSSHTKRLTQSRDASRNDATGEKLQRHAPMTRLQLVTWDNMGNILMGITNPVC